jgi:prephenate dehydrogenase
MIQRLCVIGVGLIGGSLARALRDAGAVEHIVGCGRSAPNLIKAVEMGVIDEYIVDAAEAVRGADMVVVATALSATPIIFEKIATAINATTVVTDVGSAKARVVEAARRSFGDDFHQFVPGHPIAGTEKSGVEASFAELFQEHRVILTPLAETNPEALNRVAAMWKLAGANVTEMDVEQHDKVLAATSHLPHMLAYALVDCLAKMDQSEDVFRYAAGGFRDFTRIASSSPEMWCDISLDNREAILTVLDSFSATYERLRHALENDNRGLLLEIFSGAKAARERAALPRSKS